MQQGGDKIDDDLLAGILVQVWQGYADFNVTYHNDIHGFDVAQMTYLCLYSPNGVNKKLNLNPIDIFATLFGALCHDYEHDGFNNQFHVSARTIRFKCHGENAV